ncbi:amidase [Halegenticoccus tardaugens]|uniref:amidase n=1 Tax=Halegenticoccus tardaugens TaxID=2071624 RepID=UPI00100C0276|nr:amidase family protein [Halegenticoccus tardaugens]
MTTDICDASAEELAASIRVGEVSPVAVVDAFLDRIDRIDSRINAYATVCDEAARKAARSAERAVERGDALGPLHGVPVAIKDLTRVRGVRTTFGSAAFTEHVPDRDDTVVARLREAGAIVLGKTNTPEFGRKTVTDNLVFGSTGNPWDPTKTTGGSSGGSAAAVAAGLTPLALGSDAAGSIRIPASACGVFGLVPDFGRVPEGPTRADAFETALPCSFLGPIARSVGDAALMLDVLAGPHPADPYCLPTPSARYRDALGAPISDLRIGYSANFGGFRVTEEVRAAVEGALDRVAAAGATVETADLDFDGTWEDRHEALERILQTRYVGLYENLRRDAGVDLLNDDLDVTPEVTSRIRAGLSLGAQEIAAAGRTRTAVFDEIQRAFSGYDVLATPTLSRTAFDRDEDAPTVDGRPVHPMHGWTLTWPLNLSGNPAGSIPVGLSDDDLPIGMQVIGPRLDDRGVVSACAAIERALTWDGTRPPDLGGGR